jgi:hypothetical protein
MAKSKAANSKEPKRAPEKSNITDDLLDAMQQSVHDMCSALGEVCTKPKSTVALLDELGNHLAETEAAGTLILNFLQPVGKLAPKVDVLPVDPNARLAYIISRVLVLKETLNSSALILGIR